MKIKKSIARQLSVVFIGLFVMVIAANLLANNFLLERYHIYSLEKSLIRVYGMIDSNVSEDGVNKEYFTENIAAQCSANNMSLVVVDENYTAIAWTSGGNSGLMMARLNGYILELEKPENVLVRTENYLIQKKFEPMQNMDFLEMWGDLTSGGHFLIRIPLSSIRVNAQISFRFLVYFSIAAIAICILLVMALSKRITRPIRELTDLSRRMADLDFDARYTSGGSDEIGELGEHFNQMSETLEKTISQLKSANNQLQLDIDRKEKIDRMRTEFLSNVSHELKTPLALIQGYAEGLEECVNDDEESRRFYCEVIMDETSRMNTLVRKLLTLNELEFGNDKVELERFDIAPLINGKIQSVQIIAQQKMAEISYSGEETAGVWGDEFKVEEVLTNYLSNALNHVDGERKIEIRQTRREGKVRISVFNTGKPIPEEDIDRIWDKFYKVDKAHSREYGGSGVGLSIVKAIMDSMHQEYGVINHPDGVEFWFELDGDGNAQMPPAE